MPLPLPQYLTNIADQNTPNLSLKYYKRADVYKDNKFTELIKSKNEFFNDIIKLSKFPAYKQAFETRKRLMENIGMAFPMTTATRLVFGMGYEHPTEIGFMFDWTSGLPIMPGSSLKGIALRTIEYEREEAKDNEKAEKEEFKNKIFGSPKDGGGDIIFFPAYPCVEENKPFLELDVMTPHYQPYYSDPKKEKPPADWYSPIPLHFLTVPKDIRYCFRIANRKNLKDTKSPLLPEAKRILKSALTEFGVGAKTAVAYGYFK